MRALPTLAAGAVGALAGFGAAAAIGMAAARLARHADDALADVSIDEAFTDALAMLADEPGPLPDARAVARDDELVERMRREFAQQYASIRTLLHAEVVDGRLTMLDATPTLLRLMGDEARLLGLFGDGAAA